jgi:hypothetical protein
VAAEIARSEAWAQPTTDELTDFLLRLMSGQRSTAETRGRERRHPRVRMCGQLAVVLP